MEGDCNVYAHTSLWMRPTWPDRYNAKMVYWLILCNISLMIWSRTIWSWTIRTLLSWTINLIILKNIQSQICSMTIFEINAAPGAYSKHASGAVLIQICSWGIFDLEYSSRLLRVQDHKVLMVQDHKVLHIIGSKSHKSYLTLIKL